MFELYYQYLLLHKKATVPGLGTFIIFRNPAYLNFEQKTIAAPTWEIIFSKSNAPKDESFNHFVTQRQNTSENESSKNVSDFFANINREISISKKVDWPNIGMLTENGNGEILLRNSNHLVEYFPDVHAEMIVRENGEKSVFDNYATSPGADLTKVKDTNGHEANRKQEWLIDAVILALLAIAAIGYYYMQNGTLR